MKMKTMALAGFCQDGSRFVYVDGVLVLGPIRLSHEVQGICRQFFSKQEIDSMRQKSFIGQAYDNMSFRLLDRCFEEIGEAGSMLDDIQQKDDIVLLLLLQNLE